MALIAARLPRFAPLGTSLLIRRNQPNPVLFFAAKPRKVSAQQDVGDRAVEAVKQDKREVKRVADSITENAKCAAEAVSEKTSEVASKVSEKAKNVAEKAKETAQEAWDSAKETGQKIKDAVAEKAEDAKEVIADTAEAVKKSMNTKDTAKL